MIIFLGRLLCFFGIHDFYGKAPKVRVFPGSPFDYSSYKRLCCRPGCKAEHGPEYGSPPENAIRVED